LPYILFLFSFIFISLLLIFLFIIIIIYLLFIYFSDRRTAGEAEVDVGHAADEGDEPQVVDVAAHH
jgi:hypothetical protein